MSDKEVPQHERDITHVIHEEVPSHPQRGKTAYKFEKAKEEVEEKVKKDEGAVICYWCGRTEGELPDGEYIEGHHIVEHSLRDAVDFDKMQDLFDRGVVDPHGYSEEMEGQPVKNLYDKRNIWLLCSKCHRESPDPDDDVENGGIHNMPFPLFIAEFVVRDDYNLFANADKTES